MEIAVLKDIAQFGVGIVAVWAILMIVRAFLKSSDEKDERFIKVVTNHFEEDLKSRETLGEKLEKMGDQIEKNTFVTGQLLKFLERNNK